MRIVLASGSPRRRELMKLAGFEFDVIVPDIDETAPAGFSPDELVSYLSSIKANAVSELKSDHDVIVAADTVVAVDGKILGKPKDYSDGYHMIKLLSGRTHSVFTGVTVIKNGRKNTFSCRSDVTFFELTDDEIYRYLDTNEFSDKAGGYGIQGKACIFVKEVIGDYYNVVGLPIALTYRAINE